METINVQRRDLEVKAKAKKMRHLGLIPANVFGKSLAEPVSIQLEEGVARKLLRTKREGSKVLLNLDGKTIPVQIKEKVLNTMKNEILHISFQVLKEDEVVNSIIHILLTNEEKLGGLLYKCIN